MVCAKKTANATRLCNINITKSRDVTVKNFFIRESPCLYSQKYQKMRSHMRISGVAPMASFWCKSRAPLNTKNVLVVVSVLLNGVKVTGNFHV